MDKEELAKKLETMAKRVESSMGILCNEEINSQLAREAHRKIAEHWTPFTNGTPNKTVY